MCAFRKNDLNYTAMKPICNDHQPGHGAAQIWVLDIDGTLMPSHHVDNECYWQAVNDCFGGVPEPLDLQQFRHVTDGGILNEWMEQTRSRPATAWELATVRARFLERIEQAFVRFPEAYTASEGLAAWLDEQLTLEPGCIAIATGGWGHTARFKIRVAGLEHYGLPVFSSDEGPTRSHIMLQAQASLLQHFAAASGPSSSISTCYIGDGPWDYRASQQLEWDFIGIAEGGRAKTLHRAGAEQVFRNFAELLASKTSCVSGRKSLENAKA